MSAFVKQILLDLMAVALWAVVCTGLVMLFMGCSHNTSGVTSQKVEVTNWPKPAEQARCMLPELPVQLEVPTWPSEDEDYYRRMYVHRRDYEKMISYVNDMREWADQINACLKKLADVY